MTIQDLIKKEKAKIKMIEYQRDWEHKNGYDSLVLVSCEELAKSKRRLAILNLQNRLNRLKK